MREQEIEVMVLKPAWKEILLEMIANEKLDPWNIDITVLANSFLKKIKGMRTLEFHIPANIILACTILLKYKSNILKVVEEPVQEALPEENSYEEIPEIELLSRIPPKGTITLEELMQEMERVIKYDEQKPAKPAIKAEIITLPLPKFDIEEKMDGVFARVKEKADEEGWATFSALLEQQGAEEIIYTLVPLLHLSQKRIVELKQDEFFGEIFIHINCVT